MRIASNGRPRWRSLVLGTVGSLVSVLAIGEEPSSPSDRLLLAPSARCTPASRLEDPAKGRHRDLISSKGPFAAVWNRQAFIGPRVFTFAESEMAATVELPGDFEPHQAIVLPGGWLAREAPDVLAQIARHTKPGLLVLLVDSPGQRAAVRRTLGEHGVVAEGLRFATVPTDTGWVRDYGPIFLRDAAGGLRAVDAAYDRPQRDRDETAPRPIAERFKATTTATPLRWHGGNLLSNGRGLVVTTTQAINANIECGHQLDTVTDFLRDRCGVERLVVLEHLVGEPTGHVDMFACFTSADTIVVGRVDASVDPENAAMLDRNAARLAAVRTADGKLNVVRMAMPSGGDGMWRSFTNIVFANGTLLVPSYPDVAPAAGEKALALYRRLLGDWTVVGVDSRALARHQGGPRCVTLYVPRDAGAPSDTVAPPVD